MLQFTKQDEKFIQKYFDNADEILAASSLGIVLDTIYDFIDEKGFAPPHYDEYNDLGREAQVVYDRIFINNAPKADVDRCIVPLRSNPSWAD